MVPLIALIIGIIAALGAGLFLLVAIAEADAWRQSAISHLDEA